MMKLSLYIFIFCICSYITVVLPARLVRNYGRFPGGCECVPQNGFCAHEKFGSLLSPLMKAPLCLAGYTLCCDYRVFVKRKPYHASSQNLIGHIIELLFKNKVAEDQQKFQGSSEETRSFVDSGQATDRKLDDTSSPITFQHTTITSSNYFTSTPHLNNVPAKDKSSNDTSSFLDTTTSASNDFDAKSDSSSQPSVGANIFAGPTFETSDEAVSKTAFDVFARQAYSVGPSHGGQSVKPTLRVRTVGVPLEIASHAPVMNTTTEREHETTSHGSTDLTNSAEHWHEYTPILSVWNTTSTGSIPETTSNGKFAGITFGDDIVQTRSFKPIPATTSTEAVVEISSSPAVVQTTDGATVGTIFAGNVSKSVSEMLKEASTSGIRSETTTSGIRSETTTSGITSETTTSGITSETTTFGITSGTDISGKVAKTSSGSVSETASAEYSLSTTAERDLKEVDSMMPENTYHAADLHRSTGDIRIISKPSLERLLFLQPNQNLSNVIQDTILVITSTLDPDPFDLEEDDATDVYASSHSKDISFTTPTESYSQMLINSPNAHIILSQASDKQKDNGRTMSKKHYIVGNNLLGSDPNTITDDYGIVESYISKSPDKKNSAEELMDADQHSTEELLFPTLEDFAGIEESVFSVSNPTKASVTTEPITLEIHDFKENSWKTSTPENEGNQTESGSEETLPVIKPFNNNLDLEKFDSTTIISTGDDEPSATYGDNVLPASTNITQTKLDSIQQELFRKFIYSNMFTPPVPIAVTDESSAMKLFVRMNINEDDVSMGRITQSVTIPVMSLALEIDEPWSGINKLGNQIETMHPGVNTSMDNLYDYTTEGMISDNEETEDVINSLESISKKQIIDRVHSVSSTGQISAESDVSLSPLPTVTASDIEGYQTTLSEDSIHTSFLEESFSTIPQPLPDTGSLDTNKKNLDPPYQILLYDMAGMSDAFPKMEEYVNSRSDSDHKLYRFYYFYIQSDIFPMNPSKFETLQTMTIDEYIELASQSILQDFIDKLSHFHPRTPVNISPDLYISREYLEGAPVEVLNYVDDFTDDMLNKLASILGVDDLNDKSFSYSDKKVETTDNPTTEVVTKVPVQQSYWEWIFG